MRGAESPRGLTCPDCGSALELIADDGPAAARLACPGCGATFRARRRGAPADPTPEARPPAPVGGLSLWLRGRALRGLERAYHVGVALGSVAQFALGGFVPVVDGWLRDEVSGWGDAIEAMGGVRVVAATDDPDADLGPVLAFADAPGLFLALTEVARRLGARPPQQVRLTYLPACGVVAWGRGRSRAMVLGLPLLYVLTMEELRAVLAHELAHLARGDATEAADSARFVAGLGQALNRAGAAPRRPAPLRSWARLCHRAASRLVGPIALGQEARADRASAAAAGGGVAASALVKVAMMQPLFREVLRHYDPDTSDSPTLYAFFRAFWDRLPLDVLAAMRLRLISDTHAPTDPTHPPLPDRIAALQSFPDRPSTDADRARAWTALGDAEALEQMLHDRLFSMQKIEPSVFHRAGT